MDQNNLYKKDLDLACNTPAPSGVMFVNMNDEIEMLQEYLGKQFNNLEVTKELKGKANEINFFESNGFKDWFKKRIDFYKSDWEKLIKNEEEIINDHIFLSETFKILNKCSWWVQNAYQSYSGLGAKDLLNNLDCISATLEKELNNKDILIKKANNFCYKKCDLRGKCSMDCDRNQREKERQIFAFFAELKVAEELNNSGFKNIRLILEKKDIKTPDLSAKKDDFINYIEVKRMQNPREEDEAIRSTGQYSGGVNSQFYKPLKKKIGDFICDAEEKFKDITSDNIKISKEQKILVIDFAPGNEAGLNSDFSATNLGLIFGKDCFLSLEIEHNMTIWTRKYF